MKDSWIFGLQGFWARHSKTVFVTLGFAVAGLLIWPLLFPSPSVVSGAGSTPVVSVGEPLPRLELGRSRIALPVPVGVANLFKSGNRIDIYVPGECKDSLNCPARRVAADVLVVSAEPESAGWSGSTESTLVLDVTNIDIESLAGVSETTILRYILINEK
ncbi:hypothetical protein HMPREF0044_1537 [Gleimia coleocanis DSM 15436]|uniref:Uncharacterized protein n=1 Tax=Gleimia coleocanis DSM 15436 TaxID=525245 RepID=C0W284_9ACTO|nr:hypothetical protein [Gleimia coleocanis]EEH63298.1 hypothetical protein HMPREF0044_1537 [Gleimia coleocanis DSM 15436]